MDGEKSVVQDEKVLKAKSGYAVDQHIIICHFQRNK